MQPPKLREDPLISPQELADRLGLAIHTVYGWRKERSRVAGPPCFMVGGRLRYRLSEVEAWLESQRETRASA